MRVIAGVCSVVGIMYLMGWEVEIGRQILGGLIGSTGEIAGEQSMTGATWLASGIVFGCLLYTVLGGLRGNASADIVLNLMKLLTIGFITFLLLKWPPTQTQVSFWSAMFPSVATMQENLGWWGMITNIAFSLTWQFVDTSTWQSVIAGVRKKDDAVWNLCLSGVAIFIAPGILGTLLGVSLAGSPGITAENILVKAVSLAPSVNGMVLFFMFVAVVACVMSMIDGLFLASAYALVVDIMHPNKRLSQLDAVPEEAERLLIRIRIALIFIAIVAIWGARFLINDVLKGSLFDFVYIVIITQLALIGPVLTGLLNRVARRFPLWLPIFIALAIGFGSIIVGTKFDIKWLIDGAGTFTIFASCIASLGSTKPNISRTVKEVKSA